MGRRIETTPVVQFILLKGLEIVVGDTLCFGDSVELVEKSDEDAVMTLKRWDDGRTISQCSYRLIPQGKVRLLVPSGNRNCLIYTEGSTDSYKEKDRKLREAGL